MACVPPPLGRGLGGLSPEVGLRGESYGDQDGPQGVHGVQLALAQHGVGHVRLTAPSR